ncbi:MAG: glycosyltransferase family 39 protein, partial [Acidimicrobiales bacterium]
PVQAAREQATVGGGQVVAGAGNLAFALVMAHLLAPGSFAQLASFLALYTVLSMPGTSISAVAALGPGRTSHLRPVMRWGGLAIGILLAAGSPWIGHLLRLPVAMVVVLGLSGPVLWSVALERGHLYGWHRYSRLVASLVAEPAVRLTLGIGLAVAFGAIGGAVGVTVAGFGALEIARRRGLLLGGSHRRGNRTESTVGPGAETHDARSLTWTALGFLGLVIVQNQDLLIANRMLTPADAGRFAVLSTIGGLAAFATLTVPLVLLPRSAGGERNALGAAMGAALLLGGGALAVVAVAPQPLVAHLFGDRYGGIAPLAVPYVLAMALLGFARVLAAHRCAVGAARSTACLVILGAVAQAVLILRYGHTPGAIALSTLTATSGLTLGLGGAVTIELPAVRDRARAITAALTRPATLVVSGAFALGLGLRVAVPRGLWLDEVTSVMQARMSFTGMIHNLRVSDVHPPLYFAVLWATIRWLGSSGELAVRVPSIIAGSLVVPMLYALGKEAYDRRTGMVAAAVGSVAPLMVWYSQEARMYALLMLFGVTAMWAQVRVLKRGGAFAWVVYALSSAAMVWTQYFGLLQVLAQQLVFLAVIWHRRRHDELDRPLVLGWALSVVAIAVALYPLVPFAYHQFVVNQTAGRGFGGPSNVGTAASLSGNHIGIYSMLANLIWAVGGYHSNAVMALLGALWPLGMLVALALLGSRRQPVTTLMVLAVAVPVLGMFALGLVKPALFDVRYLSTIVPVLVVLVGRGLSGFIASPRLLRIGLAATLLVMVGALGDQQLNGTNPRLYDFRGALQQVDRQAKPGDVVLYDPRDIARVVTYYSPHAHAEAITPSTPQTIRAIDHAHRVFVVSSAPLIRSDADHGDLATALAVLNERDHLVARRPMSNVTLWIYR